MQRLPSHWLLCAVLLFALGLTGCGGGGSSSGGGSSVTTLTDANGNPITIVSNREDGGDDGGTTTLADSNNNPVTTVHD